jgi:hypothetical protein
MTNTKAFLIAAAAFGVSVLLSSHQSFHDANSMPVEVKSSGLLSVAFTVRNIFPSVRRFRHSHHF